MKSCLDKDFVYVRAIDTDIRKTFDRIRKAAPQVPNVEARPNHDGSVGQSHSEASLATRLKAETPAVSAPNQKTAAQELPAVNSASRQDTSSSSNPGTVGRSDIRPTKVDAEPVRDSAKQPAFAAPVTQIRRKTCSSR